MSTESTKENIGLFKKFVIFLSERFGLVGSPMMISLFVLSHLGLVYSHNELYAKIYQIISLFLGVILFFVKLRFYDEIKDYELDKIINPNRPLPRGLLTIDHIKNAIKVVILFELILFSIIGLPALISMGLTIGYSLLMYKEFFIGKYIRPHLTTYATSHTVVTLFLSISIFSAISNTNFWKLDMEYFYFSLTSWLIFNIFELGRKVFQPDEEREGVESYSLVWGRWGATLLVLSHASLVYYLSNQIKIFKVKSQLSPLMIPIGILILVSILYLATKKNSMGNLYRNTSSVYILLSYIVYLAMLTYGLYPNWSH